MKQTRVSQGDDSGSTVEVSTNDSAPRRPVLKIRLWSTPESVQNGRISVLAILETTAAIALVSIVVSTTKSLAYVAIPALLAPFLLLRTSRSIGLGLSLWGAIYNWACRIWGVEQKKWSFRRHFLMLETYTTRRVLTIPCAIVLPVVAFMVRFAATFVTFICHPIQSIGAVPWNWWRIAMATDLAHPPEILPGTEAVSEPGIDRFSDLLTLIYEQSRLAFARRGRIPVLRWVVGATYPAVALLAMTLWYGPALAYRWSLKSTTIIWFPLLWALRSVRDAGKPLRTYLSMYVHDLITVGVLWVSIAAIIGLAAKIALFNEWAGYVEWWNATPLRRVLSLYVTPAEIQWWQVAMVINSAIAIAMYMLARRWLARIEHDELTDESLPRRLFQVGLFIRPILSCYTIACTLYITIRAASEWQLPALGTRPFPWM